ncbi:hypothetical protein LABOLPEG_00019 [Pseudomonas phage phi 21A]|nr:hypothetical protein LABOLPEG_00019 [Pseudomonas phage phi 21A]
MSITLKTKITITSTIVISSETVAKVQKEREEARRMDPFKSEKLKGTQRAMFEVYISDRSDEEVFELLLRMGFREGFKETIKSELSGDDFRMKGAQIAVQFKGKTAK